MNSIQTKPHDQVFPETFTRPSLPASPSPPASLHPAAPAPSRPPAPHRSTTRTPASNSRHSEDCKSVRVPPISSRPSTSHGTPSPPHPPPTSAPRSLYSWDDRLFFLLSLPSV